MHIEASKVGEKGFNTQPPEGGCSDHGKCQYKAKVSTHSHPKVAAVDLSKVSSEYAVSTHSHPKVAAFQVFVEWLVRQCFNTQPPEGGCNVNITDLRHAQNCFNTQPPEGGCN